VYDATPFTFSEEPNNTAISYFAEQLEQAGYNYYGTETLYSGVSGVEIKVRVSTVPPKINVFMK
jgi:DNA-directed RNA polymerase I subunit RPA2